MFIGKRCLRLISTELIKQQQKGLERKGGYGLKEYPKTFNQKIQLLNDPRAIQAIELIEFGVKYKKGNKYFIWLILFLAFSLYLEEFQNPIHITDMYFRISTASELLITKIFAAFKFQSPFYLYIPQLPCIYQLTRFITIPNILSFLAISCFVNGIVGKLIVESRVKKYEIWDSENVSYGEGTWLALCFLFWSSLGFRNGINHLKSKVFLKAVKGIGIVRGGIPVSLFCAIYGCLEVVNYLGGKKNSELVFLNVMMGIVFGLGMRKIRPIV